MNEEALLHSDSWWAVVLWIVLFASFLLFLPVDQKAQRKPAGAYLLFVTAMALEMFGIPLSLYAISFISGVRPPAGILWGHTLSPFIGTAGHYVFLGCVYVGGMLVVAGWATIRRTYWNADDGTGELVSTGIYRFIRHPQYGGLLLVSLGMLFEWTSLAALAFFPLVCAEYLRLASREETGLEQRFRGEWLAYRGRTGKFFPRIGDSRRKGPVNDEKEGDPHE